MRQPKLQSMQYWWSYMYLDCHGPKEGVREIIGQPLAPKIPQPMGNCKWTIWVGIRNLVSAKLKIQIQLLNHQHQYSPIGSSIGAILVELHLFRSRRCWKVTMGNRWQVLSAGNPAANQSSIGHVSEVEPTSKQTYLKRHTYSSTRWIWGTSINTWMCAIPAELCDLQLPKCSIQRPAIIRILGNPLAPKISRPIRERAAVYIHVVPSVLV